MSKPQTWHLNLKWTMAKVDALIAAVKTGLSAEELAHNGTKKGFPCTPDEIIRICDDAKVFVHRKRRRA